MFPLLWSIKGEGVVLLRTSCCSSSVHFVLAEFVDLVASQVAPTVFRLIEQCKKAYQIYHVQTNFYFWIYFHLYQYHRHNLDIILFSAAYVLPSRDSLSLGERVIAYLPRCADTSYEVRKVAVQVGH